MADDLEHLMSLAQTGDSAAFAELYDSLLHPICEQLRAAGCGNDVEDAFQETMIKLWRSLNSFATAKGDVLSWVIRIARNVALDLHRRQRRKIRGGGVLRRQDIDLFKIATESQVQELDEVREVITEEIEALPSQLSRDVLRTVMDGYPVCTVADRNGVSQATANRRYRLIIRHFKTSLRLKEMAGAM